ncbi:unnamed protein product, partial [Ilex paraguariensis]
IDMPLLLDTHAYYLLFMIRKLDKDPRSDYYSAGSYLKRRVNALKHFEFERLILDYRV